MEARIGKLALSRRVVDGAGERFGDNDELATLISRSGATPPDDCRGQPSSQCLRADGSGWVLA